MAYDPRYDRPVEPPEERGSLTGYAAIKYTAIVIVVLAILAFLAWAIVKFVG